MDTRDEQSAAHMGTMPPVNCLYLELSPQDAWPVCSCCGARFRYDRRGQSCGGTVTSGAILVEDPVANARSK